MQGPRIGVYVCWCGTNIAKMVDVERVAEQIKDLPGVVVSRTYKYMCSDPGQDLIIKDIKEHELNRVVVAACSPRIHEPTFRKALQNAGLNPYMLAMANIREHNSWVHTDRAEATRKARDLVAAAVSRVNFNEPLDERLVPVHPATLVLGAGVTGMTAALEIADCGKQVFLVEKTDALGGMARHLDRSSGDTISMRQHLEPLIGRVSTHPNIALFLGAQISKIAGYVGSFEATVTCGGQETQLAFGNTILATGLVPMDPSGITEYGYGRLPDVVTSAEFEHMLSSGRITKKDGTAPRHVAIIHCVGSRNRKYHEYCSRVCCITALKYASQVRTMLPDSSVYQLYADIRAIGKGGEALYAEATRRNVMLLMFDQEGDLPRIREAGPRDGCSMLIEMDEKLTGKELEVPADLVVLMVSQEAPKTAKEVAHAAGVSLDGNGFFIEKHPKLDPVATTTGGVYIAGTCQGPKDITDAVSQARAAAARVLRNISRGSVPVEVITSKVNSSLCSGCKMCLTVCPYSAITFDDKKQVSLINEVLCQGCGTCVALCRPRAIDQAGYSSRQMEAELIALLTTDDVLSDDLVAKP